MSIDQVSGVLVAIKPLGHQLGVLVGHIGQLRQLVHLFPSQLHVDEQHVMFHEGRCKRLGNERPRYTADMSIGKGATNEVGPVVAVAVAPKGACMSAVKAAKQKRIRSVVQFQYSGSWP